MLEKYFMDRHEMRFKEEEMKKFLMPVDELDFYDPIYHVIMKNVLCGSARAKQVS